MGDIIKKPTPTIFATVANPLNRPGYVRKKKLQTMLDSVTQQMYARNKELADTNKTLSLLRTIDALVMEPHASLKTVCEHITEAIAQSSEYPFVGLFTKPSHSEDIMRLYGWSGNQLLSSNLPLEIGHPVHLNPESPWLSDSISSRMVPVDATSAKALTNFVDCSEDQLNVLLRKVPLKTIYAVKLIVRRRLVGVMIVGFYNPVSTIFGSEVQLLDRLCESIAVSIDNKLLYEENQHVLRQLRLSNAKLKALDEAKDDFVSMASHQLRTPLTSVKGYISMVMEGDAGPITPMQEKLLKQSFVSSQRMVYMIADLLNVSRLRTGKFIIERRPVNLADIIVQELDQLQETAASRSLTIDFKKPKNFPSLMLDETKTRQIIMNFADNAIYYTPTGGKIAIKLTETDSCVEFRVNDNGIGVPKAEQRHLFTKFYRAGNARKARPDGTGLGLYMAKKVIVAQGGNLVFESKEGKGSSFGFVFSKTKLSPPLPAE